MIERKYSLSLSIWDRNRFWKEKLLIAHGGTKNVGNSAHTMPGARIILEVNCTGCHRPCLRNGWTFNSHSLHCNCRLVVIVKNCFFCNMALTSSEQSCQLSSASADRAGLSIAEKADQRQSESEWGRTTRVWTERTTRWKASGGFINPNPLDLPISTIFFVEIFFEECKWYSYTSIFYNNTNVVPGVPKRSKLKKTPQCQLCTCSEGV